ncbi:MAG: ComEC/Rec2 family competence protein, partial [Candidatus Krumholzibacteriota bacterium]|nr:ComEC/Rec2 family competence protein [Candidatus Krumholzibacteriota bacterium]
SGFPSTGRFGTTFPFDTRVGDRLVRLRVRSKRFDVRYGDRLMISGARRNRRNAIAGMAGEFRATSQQRLEGFDGDPVRRQIFWPLHRRARMVLSRRLGGGSSLALALSLGERGFISRHQRREFVRLGISHLFALSGMHLGILAALVVLILPGRPWWGTALLAAGLCLFVLVVGDIDSLERALVMALLALLARALGRPVRPLHIWASAACLLLWREPVSLASVGLQFSLLATLGVLVTLERLRFTRAWVRNSGRLHRTFIGIGATIAIGVGATLAVLPLQLHYFEVVSPIGPIATVVFTPVAGTLLITSLLLVLLDPLPFVPGVMTPVVEAVSTALSWMLHSGASIAPPVLRVPVPDATIYYAGLLISVFCTGRRVRSAGVLILVASFFVRS